MTAPRAACQGACWPCWPAWRRATCSSWAFSVGVSARARPPERRPDNHGFPSSEMDAVAALLSRGDAAIRAEERKSACTDLYAHKNIVNSKTRLQNGRPCIFRERDAGALAVPPCFSRLQSQHHRSYARIGAARSAGFDTPGIAPQAVGVRSVGQSEIVPQVAGGQIEADLTLLAWLQGDRLLTRDARSDGITQIDAEGERRLDRGVVAQAQNDLSGGRVFAQSDPDIAVLGRAAAEMAVEAAGAVDGQIIGLDREST